MEPILSKISNLQRYSIRIARKFSANCPQLQSKVPRVVTTEEAFQCLKSGQTVFCQGAAATPTTLLDAMADYGIANKLSNITVCHMHTEGEARYTDPSCEGIFRSLSFFMGGNVRKAVADGRGSCIPIFLSEIPKLFHRGIVKPDISLIQVSLPDEHGFCTLGTSVDCVKTALDYSKTVIALVNSEMPRVFGDGVINIKNIDYLVEGNVPLPVRKTNLASEEESLIGKHIAENLIVDGSTLQMGIGNIPDAVLSQLKYHKNLGIHSEMIADGVVDLVENGCITNEAKVLDKGHTVGSFLIGSKKLYTFVDNNPAVQLRVVDYVNNHSVIVKQPNMVAINSCIEVDLTGQVVADSIGKTMYSGFGGQVDFIRAAGDSRDGNGKPIIAVQSQTRKGVSKIVPYIKEGAGVVTSRAHVQYIVTEFGVANLFGKDILQRAYSLINIAHPSHREHLERAAFERFKAMPTP